MICGRTPVQRHHVFPGTSNRKNSDEDGFWIPLCMKHHQRIHIDTKMALYWKAFAQIRYEKTHSRMEFIQRYNRSYL